MDTEESESDYDSEMEDSKSDHDSEMEESVSRGRLSELPNSLIHLIFSFLSMRDVISTTLLSKRWANLWTTVPYLNFREDASTKESIRNFVNRVLIMWNGTNILKFEINIYNLYDSSLDGDLDLWVWFAVKNRVEDLEISLAYEVAQDRMETAYSIPQCLKSCSSIRKLSLWCCNLQIHEPPSWNQLESFDIYGHRLSEHLINLVLLGSPRLEVFKLSLMDSHDDLNITSTSLKKLMIERYEYYAEWDESTLDRVCRICCPNLKVFEFSQGLYGKFLFTDVSSLTDATLCFGGDFWCRPFDEHLCLNEFGETMRQIFSTHVEKVALSHWTVRWCVQVLDASPKNYLYSPNVTVLKVGLKYVRKFAGLVYLLGIFPNLKVLVIKGLDSAKPLDFNSVKGVQFETNISKSSLRQLETIQITSKLSDVSIFKFIEIFLKHAIKLEKLVLRCKTITSFRKMTLLQISEKLLSMPRSSPAAKVILKAC